MKRDSPGREILVRILMTWLLTSLKTLKDISDIQHPQSGVYQVGVTDNDSSSCAHPGLGRLHLHIWPHQIPCFSALFVLAGRQTPGQPVTEAALTQSMRHAFNVRVLQQRLLSQAGEGQRHVCTHIYMRSGCQHKNRFNLVYLRLKKTFLQLTEQLGQIPPKPRTAFKGGTAFASQTDDYEPVVHSPPVPMLLMHGHPTPEASAEHTDGHFCHLRPEMSCKKWVWWSDVSPIEEGSMKVKSGKR